MYGLPLPDILLHMQLSLHKLSLVVNYVIYQFSFLHLQLHKLTNLAVSFPGSLRSSAGH